MHKREVNLTDQKRLRARHGIGGFGCPCCNLLRQPGAKAKKSDARYIRRVIRQQLAGAL